MKKVIIIGGGVSGLSAGIYLQASGYETEILEKNHVVGGACIGWERKGCYIDGCIHWLSGVNPKSSLYQLWRETDAIKADIKVFYQDDLAHFIFGDGKKFTYWADIDKLQKELIEFAPEDKKAIKLLCRMIRRFQKVNPPAAKPADLMNLWELLKVGLTMAIDYYWICRCSKLSCEDFAKRFKNPYIRKVLAGYMESDYNLMSFFYMMGHVTAHDAGIPEGGSVALVKRMADKYLSLGGKITTRASVKRVIVENDRAKGVLLENGQELEADWVVSTVPVEHCLKSLLENKYRVEKIDMRLSDRKTYPIYTFTTVVFKCKKDISSLPLSTKIYLDKSIVIDKEYACLGFRNYSYDKTIMNEGQGTVVQSALCGNDEMYFWWKEKKENGTYEAEKKRIADECTQVFKKTFPDLADDIEVIDIITPCTYERYLNSRHGCFQGFVHTSRGKSLMQKGIIKGLGGFILGGQWILQSGGLPPAVMTGRFSALRICKADKTKFVAPKY